VAEIVGWYGAVAILLAYALNSLMLLGSGSIAFQLLNITGSMGLLLIGYHKRVYQAVLINLVWLIIGSIALLNILR